MTPAARYRALPNGPRLTADQHRLLRELLAADPRPPSKMIAAEFSDRTGREFSDKNLRDYTYRYGLTPVERRRLRAAGVGAVAEGSAVAGPATVPPPVSAKGPVKDPDKTVIAQRAAEIRAEWMEKAGVRYAER